MRWSPLGRDIGIGAIVALLSGLLAGMPELVYLGVLAAGGVLSAATVLVRRVPTATMAADLPARISPPTDEAFAVRLGERHASAVVHLTVGVDGSEHVSERMRVAAGPPTAVRWRCPPLARGRHQLGPVAVRVTDPLGAAHRDRVIAARRDVIVHPRRVVVAAVPMTSDRLLDGTVRTHSPVGGQAEDGVGRYRHGDDLRLIHGPQTRRRGVLMLRRRVIADESPAIVLLDTAAGPYGDATFEDAVSVAASLVCATATRGRPVELHTTTRGVLRRGVGPAIVTPALDALALVERDHVRSRAARPRLPATGAGPVVLVTGVLDVTGAAVAATLSRRAALVGVIAMGKQPSASLPYPHVAAADAASAALGWNRLVHRR
jgi:uncharacterized protein (DUF58 family)